MRMIKSCKCLFVFVLLTFLFSGCTGSSSPSSLNNNIKTNSNIVPNDGADTFDFANIMKGTWIGISGRGTATGHNGTFNLTMSTFDYTVPDAQVNGDNGKLTLLGDVYWDVFNQNGKHVYWYRFYSSNDTFDIVHIGTNTWRYEFPNKIVLTFRILSKTTAQVIQEGVVNVNGFNYNYTLNMNLQKRTYGYETYTEPNTDTVNNEVETETETNNLTDTFDIQEILTENGLE